MWPTTVRSLVVLLFAIQISCSPCEQDSLRPVDDEPAIGHEKSEAAPGPDKEIPSAAAGKSSPTTGKLEGFRSECASLEAYETGSLFDPPEALVKVVPEFGPVALRTMRVEGVVILKVIVTASGEVCDAIILKGLMKMFDEPIRNAVLQWRFAPTYFRGRPVAVVFTVTVKIGL